MTKPAVRATPFHARAAAQNPDNAWLTRNGVTLAADYGDANDEALAARTRAVMADISWRWRVMLEGARAGEFLSRLVTRDAQTVAPGYALKALWLNDGGGVRGAGAIARYGKESFLLAASAPDADWIAAAAKTYEVEFRDISATEGGLGVIGPYAQAILQAAELATDIEPLQFRKLFWRGTEVTVSRFGEHGGYEIWCAPDDGVLVWDRIAQTGFGVQPAGVTALDVLDLEAGVARPERDYAPARDGIGAEPNPRALGLELLIDKEHPGFNGRTAWLAAREKEKRRLVGIEIDSETPASHTPLLAKGRPVGRTLRSAYSPALRRAVALAQIDAALAVPGTALSLTLPPSAGAPELRAVPARVVDLPFLAAPVFLAP